LQTNGLVLCLAFFLWGHAEVALGFFLSNFFGRPRTATIVGYLLVIAGIIIALLLEGLQVLASLIVSLLLIQYPGLLVSRSFHLTRRHFFST